MASFTQRGEVWFVQVARKGVRKSASFPTKRQAKDWANRIEAEILGGVKAAEGQHTLREALARYRDTVSVKKRGERWERVRLDAFAKSLTFADKFLANITPADIADWRDARLRVVKGSSVARDMVLLSSVFETCRREWGWLIENPMKEVRKPSAQPARTRLISDRERDAIVQALGYAESGPLSKSGEVALAFLISLETAMRAGEVLKISTDTLDVAQKTVCLAVTKNGDAREVPLSSKALALCMRALPGFTVSSASLDALFRKARDKAGIKDLHFHDARATALTMLSKKVDVLTLARIAGHRDLKMLLVYYRESAASVAARLD